jgi:hypothetical protein
MKCTTVLVTKYTKTTSVISKERNIGTIILNPSANIELKINKHDIVAYTNVHLATVMCRLLILSIKYKN